MTSPTTKNTLTKAQIDTVRDGKLSVAEQIAAAQKFPEAFQKILFSENPLPERQGEAQAAILSKMIAAVGTKTFGGMTFPKGIELLDGAGAQKIYNALRYRNIQER